MPPHARFASALPYMRPAARHFPRIDALVSFAVDERLQWYLPADAGLTLDGCSLLLSARSKAGGAAIAQILLEQYAHGLSAHFGREAPSAVEAFEAIEGYKPSPFPPTVVDSIAAVQAAVDYEETPPSASPGICPSPLG